MTERTLEYYLREEGVYRKTVAEVVLPYFNQLDCTPPLFEKVDADLKDLKSPLYIDFDKHDKRIKSCFVAGYLALKDYQETLDTENHADELAHVNKMLGFFEEDIKLKPGDLRGKLGQIVGEVQSGLNEWVALNELQGAYQKAQKALIITYISMRTLWVKLTKDWLVSRFVSEDIKSSLLDSQKILKDYFIYWHDKKVAEEAKRLEEERAREANSGFSEQVNLVMSRLESGLEVEKEGVKEHYQKRSQLAIKILPLVNIYCTCFNVDNFITALCTTYDADARKNLFQVLQLSGEQLKKVDAVLNPTSSIFGFFIPHSPVEIYDLLKKALDMYLHGAFPEYAEIPRATLYDARQFLQAYQDEDYLVRKLGEMDSRKDVFETLKEKLCEQDLMLDSLRVVEREDEFFDCFSDDEEPEFKDCIADEEEPEFYDCKVNEKVTEALREAIVASRKELQAAKDEVEKKQELFESWCQNWQDIDAAAQGLTEAERSEIEMISSRLIDDLHSNLLDSTFYLEQAYVEDRLEFCRNIYANFNTATANELSSTKTLIHSLNNKTANQALGLLKDYVEERRQSIWHKLVCVFSPTYKACFNAISQGVTAKLPESESAVSAYATVSRIEKNIKCSLERCSWKFIRKMAERPFSEVMKNLFFLPEESESCRTAENDSLSLEW